MPRVINNRLHGELPAHELRAHRMGLNEIDEGFDRPGQGEAARQVVVF